MYGAVRVLVFFFGIVVIPCILLITPLYLKHKVFCDVIYAVTESDVLEIKDGISSVFCQAQTIKMNSTFNAFQIDNHQVDTTHKKHFRLRKSMSLPDDSLEYWGFFLNKGSIVNLSLCSRFEGGKIMIVKDIKDFHTCGLLERTHKIGADPHVNIEENEVQVIYDPNAEIIHNSNENEGEKSSQEALDELKKQAEDYIRKKTKRAKSFPEETPAVTNPPIERKARSIYDETVTHMKGLLHGKTTNESSDSSVSSFENSLITCHEGRILLNNNFTYSHHCNGTDFLENQTHIHTQIQHDVQADGYYFYILYSDNDFVTNNIHAIFNIFKPTYEYSDSIMACLNKTECTFPISFLSREKVIAEIPMKNGIEHESEDVEILISTCQPRTLVYAIFPIAVLIVILAFSFL